MEESIILLKEPNSNIAESYRGIRSSILFSNIDNNVKKIMFTSTLKGEGKSTTTLNTAFSMSEIGKKVLLIDLDLRKPSIHKKLNISNMEGVTDVLLNRDDYKKYVQHLTDNFHVLTTGKVPKNPSEVIASKSMHKLLDEASSDYDYVFIDSAPMMVTDPIVLSSETDGLVYVLESGTADIEITQRNIQKLKSANANIIGCVLNKIDRKTSRYGHYYHSYY